ncbi:uncharacterized protein LOC132091047 [Carassius carassius]|uniref:uncharacterized protein LOC132091047 n=1 Tax=Carassius carassius TaxID=217509 RepID=UPI0028690BF5|nr:uncharacterized protein LOC132091047 [Carassius carassius]
MPGPDGYRELYPCQNLPASKTCCPPKPPLKGEKWHRATDFILRRDVQEKDQQRQATQHSTVAQNSRKVIATHGLVAPPKIKPTPKPRHLKMQIHVEQSQPVHNIIMNYVPPTSDQACSDGKNNDTHLENRHSRPKTTSHKSKRVPPSIPVPARPLPKEPEKMISMMAPKNDIDEGVYMDVDTSPVQSECSSSPVLPHRQSASEVCPNGKPLLSLSKPIPAFSVHDKTKIQHNEVGLRSELVRECLVSELHKKFSGAIKERDCSTKKSKVFKAKGDHSPQMLSNSQLEICSLCFHTKRPTDGERLHENVSISKRI